MKNLRCDQPDSFQLAPVPDYSLTELCPHGRRDRKRCFACIELAEAEEWYAQQREMMAERAPA